MTALLHTGLPLALNLCRRDLHERYQGSMLGIFWLLFPPLFMLCIYTLVFGEILQLRFGTGASTREFAFYLFTGLIAFNALAEVMTRSPAILREKRDLLLNTPLPASILPLVPVLSSILLELIALLILSMGLILAGLFQPSGLLLYLPCLLVRILLSLALAYPLGILGVFFPDLRQIMPAIMTVLMFLSPILYPLEAIPDRFQPWYAWNLLGQLVQCYRAALLEGWLPWETLAALLLVATLLLGLGLMLFRYLMPRARYVL
ncbi:MAG TPA: ABC transporter permease [Thiolinea sp.]|nr:ABC transporter permease [Thiolinea sp.]